MTTEVSFSSAGQFWQKTADTLEDLGSRPGSIAFGSVMGLGLVSSAYGFARTFMPTSPSRHLKLDKSHSSILQDRVVAGFSLTGSVARFANWVHTEIFWGAGGLVTTGILGGIGSAMGVVRSGAKAFDALDDLSETQRLIAGGDRLGIIPQKEFRNIQWVPILNYASNILFASFCVVSIISIITGSLFCPPLMGILLFGSLIMGLAAFVMKFGLRQEEDKLELLKANDIEKNYVY